MSYILDALKKSAKDRQRGNLPDMLTVQDIVVEKPRKRFRLSYLLITALLMNAGLLVWWLAFSNTEKAKDDQAEISSSSVAINDASRDVPDSAKLSMVGSVESTTPPLAADKTPDTSVEDRRRVKGARDVAGTHKEAVLHQSAAVNNAHVPPESSPAKPKQAEVAKHLSIETAGALPDMLDEHKIYKLNELPPSIRQILPALSISALLYSSDPASRMVSINDQMTHEGEYLNGGVKVEEITRDGVIFRHQKVRFLIGLK